jgi:hypothetical protein
VELTFDVGWKVAEALLAGVAAIGGLVFRAHAARQRELTEAHAKLQSECHALDIRLTGTEASLHATKNSVVGIKDDLQSMREEIREDLRSFMETITGRIDNIVSGTPRNRK